MSFEPVSRDVERLEENADYYDEYDKVRRPVLLSDPGSHYCDPDGEDAARNPQRESRAKDRNLLLRSRHQIADDNVTKAKLGENGEQ